MEKRRDSNIELLRIFCYLGTVLLHVYGNFMPEARGTIRIFGIMINCLFNTGVSIFILISGYYGIKSLSYKKLVSFWLFLLFYSLFGEILVQTINDSFDVRGIIKAFFPIYTRRSWFMSTYFLLMIFSPWINRIVESLSEVEFLKLCFAFFTIFSLIPSCIGWTFFNDSGKGIGNLFFIYLVGQYFSKYLSKYKINKTYCIYVGLTVFGVMMFLTTIKTVWKREVGIEGPFYRDASVLTVILSVTIFLFFIKCSISSRVINFIARRGMCIFLIDGIIIKFILSSISIPQNGIGILYCIGTVLLILIIAVAIESVRYPISCVIDKVVIHIIESLREKIVALDVFSYLKNKFCISE